MTFMQEHCLTLYLGCGAFRVRRSARDDIEQRLLIKTRSNEYRKIKQKWHNKLHQQKFVNLSHTT